jgi:pimeloyl-ACP methyl ester carboxylesterase
MDKILSKDGVPLALWRSGAGPPLVLVHGTGGSSARWTPVLPALETHFSIYAMDRRGRGGSGDAPVYAIEREFDDVASVVNSIGQVSNLLGHSYGAICSLEAALFTPHLRRLVLYEPPIPVEGVPIYSAGIIEHLESLSAAGGHEKVLTTFLREVVRMPSHELELVQTSPAWPARVAVAHTLPRELRAHERYRFKPERFKNCHNPTLLLLGGDSPGFFKAAIEVLNDALPNSRVVVLPGQQHIAMETAPELFVHEVLSFLKDPA